MNLYVCPAFFPGPRGAQALARAIFGIDNRWGRLPYSILKASVASSFDLADATYSMANRTYRYAPPGSALFEFGHGLSYTSFSIEWMSTTGCGSSSNACSITVAVSNSGCNMIPFPHLFTVGAQVDAVAMQLFCASFDL